MLFASLHRSLWPSNLDTVCTGCAPGVQFPSTTVKILSPAPGHQVRQCRVKDHTQGSKTPGRWYRKPYRDASRGPRARTSRERKQSPEQGRDQPGSRGVCGGCGGSSWYAALCSRLEAHLAGSIASPPALLFLLQPPCSSPEKAKWEAWASR